MWTRLQGYANNSAEEVKVDLMQWQNQSGTSLSTDPQHVLFLKTWYQEIDNWLIWKKKIEGMI